MASEPTSATMLAARLARAFPTLSVYSAAVLAGELCSIERAQRRHAERCCNGDYRRLKTNAELGYVKSAGTDPAFYYTHDPRAEDRAGERIERITARWLVNLGSRLIVSTDCPNEQPSDHACGLRAQDVAIERTYDPRGAVLAVRLPGEREGVSV
jgi:hypothetical protein